jgi:Ala-tRNA(Pro) deacylase
MLCLQRLSALLDARQLRYDIVPHREAFTAQEVAHASHITGRRLAKVVVVREGNRNYFLVVLPANAHLDFGILRRMTGRKELGLATEDDLRRLFPDCEAGAMPPFGVLYNLPMYVDSSFRHEAEIFFQAGNHHEVLRMKFADFERASGPFAGEFSLHDDASALAL